MADDEITDIPVRQIGAHGQPVVIGRAIFEDTKHMRIEFVDHEFVEEFHNLSEKEMLITVSFEGNNRNQKLLDFLFDRAKIKLSDI